MDDVIKLTSAVAWPLVALVSVVVLGPGGLLMKFAESLGGALSNFTKSLPELKSTALTMRADADTLAAKSKDMAELFANEVYKIEQQIESLNRTGFAGGCVV
jgi:Sec-independent protein translocase protein TatA